MSIGYKKASRMAKNRLAHKNFGGLIFLGIIIMVPFIIKCFFPVYESNYLGKLGFPLWCDYRNVEETKPYLGEPIKCRNEDGDIYWDYEDFTYAKGHVGVGFVIVTSENVQFGKEKIGVGSGRRDVEQAYEGIRRLDKDNKEYNKTRFGVIDGVFRRVWVEYHFDSNDRVEKIYIFDGP